jgi:RNA-directed DNA polymerase
VLSDLQFLNLLVFFVPPARTQPDHPGLGGLLPGVVSSELFGSLDSYLWKLLYKWSTWRHNNKPKHWIVAWYFSKFNKSRNDRWVFGDRDSGAYLVKFSWTAIQRHVPVKGAASHDDPALAAYWANRRNKVKPPLNTYILRLLTRQDGLCPLCGDHLLTAGQPPQSQDNCLHETWGGSDATDGHGWRII